MNILKILFLIIILFSATNLYADPMKVENDWDIIESTYVDKLSNVDNTFTLEVIDNVLQAKSIDSDEYCPIISFDYLDEILKQYEDDTTYSVFLFDDNSLHLYKYNYHVTITRVDRIVENCVMYESDIKVNYRKFIIQSAIHECYEDNVNWSESFNESITARFKNTFLVSQGSRYAFGVGRLDISEDRNKLIVDANGQYLGAFPTVKYVKSFCSLYNQIY